ncbi:MAG: mechanosensitive ion channel family protein [Chitinophagaceae bacterium]|nr:mechanosensitive ion channel family protein [Chitinophagaceae bacterium]
MASAYVACTAHPCFPATILSEPHVRSFASTADYRSHANYRYRDDEVIVNLSRKGERRLDIELKFSYAFSFDEIQRVILTTIKNSYNLLTEPAARVGIHNMESDGYVLMVNVWAPAHGFEDARQALHQKIIDDFKNAGIKLPGMT